VPPLPARPDAKSKPTRGKRICPNCWTQLPVATRHCPACGLTLPHGRQNVKPTLLDKLKAERRREIYLLEQKELEEEGG